MCSQLASCANDITRTYTPHTYLITSYYRLQFDSCPVMSCLVNSIRFGSVRFNPHVTNNRYLPHMSLFLSLSPIRALRYSMYLYNTQSILFYSVPRNGYIELHYNTRKLLDDITLYHSSSIRIRFSRFGGHSLSAGVLLVHRCAPVVHVHVHATSFRVQ